MKIIINNSSMQPIYEQLVEQIKAQIINGQLHENDVLPSVRALSKELKISALTVKKAYDHLETEGFTATIHGKGTYVKGANQELLLEERRKEVETELESTIDKGRRYGMNDDEIKALFNLIMEEEDMLELINVQKDYGRFKLNCSLEVKAGCVTGLIGQNGAGKSTTFKAVLGLISVDSGTVKLFSKDIKRLSIEDKQNIGVVLSDSGFSEYLRIEDIIPIMESLYRHFDKQMFIERVRHFELPLNKQIKEFSTGMKVKLKVLIALSHQSKLLILDEPTAGLDVIVRDELLDMLRDYMEQNEDCAIIISSHISSDLEGLCDDLYMIDQGKIVMHEETDVLLSDYAILKVDEEQFYELDKQYLLCQKRESFGYRCLTNQKQFYLENYPDVVIEKSSIDEVMTLMIRGEK